MAWWSGYPSIAAMPICPNYLAEGTTLSGEGTAARRRAQGESFELWIYKHATAKMGFLNRESLDDALMGRRRVDTSEREAGLREYLGKFVLTALDTSGDRKH
jgi:hypothetical protein